MCKDLGCIYSFMLDPSAALTLHLLEMVILRAKASYLPFR